MLPGASLARMVAQMGFDVSRPLLLIPQQVPTYIPAVRDH